MAAISSNYATGLLADKSTYSLSMPSCKIGFTDEHAEPLKHMQPHIFHTQNGNTARIIRLSKTAASSGRFITKLHNDYILMLTISEDICLASSRLYI